MTVEETAIVTATGDSSLLLGRAGCPVWLNPERFLAPEFNADACVADLRRYVPLATLQNELSSYLATLKTKLVEVINEDYADYVGLSGRLANVEGSVVRMRKPLLDLRDKLHAVQEAVRSELNSLNQGLRKRKEVATQRALLELILEVSHVAAKVDKLLEELAASEQNTTAGTMIAAGNTAVAALATAADGVGRSSSPAPGTGPGSGPGPSDAELLAQCRLLERVAAEVSRLAFLANKGKDLAFVRSLEPRIAAHRAALRGRLSTALSLALSPASAHGAGATGAAAAGPRSNAAALHALHAAADLGEATTAEAVVRSVMVAPLVERLVGEHKSHGHSSVSMGGAGSGAGASLAALLGSILAAVRSQLGPLLDASLAPGSALRSIDLLSNAVLDEVQGGLAAAMPGVFSPGVPPAFHANYLATLSWLQQLEGMCSTRGSVERLRSSAAYASLMRRWNTSVYFSLLYQEIAGELEDALSTDKLEPAAAAGASAFPGAPAPQLLATAALLRCLRRAVSPDVVLPPLTDRFLRLALQLAQRYATWVAAAATARREGPPAAPPAAASQPQTPATAPGTAAGGGSAGASGSPASSGPGPSGPSVWAPTLPADELLSVVYDTEAVHQALLEPVTAAFLELLPPVPTQSQPAADGSAVSDQQSPADGNGVATAATAPTATPSVAEAVHGALSEAATAIQSSGRGLAAVVTDEVVERCVTVVRQLKGITATYRMTSKAPPVRASHYVSGVLVPLKQLLDSGPVKRLSPRLQQELLVLPVADGVCSRYSALADELLVSVRKTESSLKRLKKAKGGVGGEEDPAAAVSDSDKITLQLHLDVEELGAQLGQLLLPPGTEPAAVLPSFRRLKEVVAPPPGLLPAAGGAADGGLL